MQQRFQLYQTRVHRQSLPRLSDKKMIHLERLDKKIQNILRQVNEYRRGEKIEKDIEQMEDVSAKDHYEKTKFLVPRNTRYVNTGNKHLPYI